MQADILALRCTTLQAVFIACLGSGLLLTGCGGAKSTSSVTTPTPPPTPQSSCSTPVVTITHTANTVNNPQLVVLDTAKYPQAVCNDGTSGAYVLRSGVGGASNRWIVSLQGGGECYDQASCSSRAANTPTLVGTASYQANPSSAFGQGGILGPTPGTNPDFYDANMVQVLYCSSDDWSGAKVGTSAYNADDPTTWNFQGRAILDSVIADLEANHGLASATEVMLTGQSAGGVGTFANANPVAKLVPASARYVAYSDAAFGNDVDNFLATGSPPNYTDTNSTPNQVAKRVPALPLWNGTGDPVCAAASASDIDSQIACYSGQTLLAPITGTIVFPMLVSTSEKDTNQLGTAGVPNSALTSGNLTTAESGYIAYFASSLRSNIASTNPNVSIFSPDVFIHVEATDPTFFNNSITFPGGNTSLQQEVGSWYKAPCSVQRNIAN
jgi:hypothetical protein